jgi:hypothetical protein
MTPQQRYNALLAKKVIKEFGNRNIQGFYVETKEEALKKALEITPKGSVVSWGGSSTLHEIGLFDSLKNGGYKVLDASNTAQGAAAQSAASQLVITTMSTFRNRISVILVGECLGF